MGKDEDGHVAARLERFEDLLRTKVPGQNRFRGVMLHFNFSDPQLLAQDVVAQCPFLDVREKSAQFSLAMLLNPLPGELFSVYVYICEVHAMSDIEAEICHQESKLEDDEIQVSEMQVAAEAIRRGVANGNAGGIGCAVQKMMEL